MYEFFLESVYLLWKNGVSISYLGALLYFFFKMKHTKKRIKKFVPWFFEDDSEVKDYVHNQHIIMSKQDALLSNQKNISEGMGIVWTAPMLPTDSKIQVKNTRKLSPLYTTMLSLAQSVRKFMKFGGKIMKKFKSRKFILAVVTGVLIVLNDGLDLGIDSHTVMTFAGVVVTWIVGESFVDGKRASATETNSNGDEYHH